MKAFKTIRLVVFSEQYPITPDTPPSLTLSWSFPGVILVFGLIILGIGANFLATNAKYRSYTSSSFGYSGYGSSGYGSSIPAFAVATAVLTFAIIIPVYVPSICQRLLTSTHLSLRLVLDFLRKGAMTSLTATELGFMGFLWILWLGGCFRPTLEYVSLPEFSSAQFSPACAGNATSSLAGLSALGCDIFYDCKLPTRLPESIHP